METQKLLSILILSDVGLIMGLHYLGKSFYARNKRRTARIIGFGLNALMFLLVALVLFTYFIKL